LAAGHRCGVPFRPEVPSCAGPVSLDTDLRRHPLGIYRAHVGTYSELLFAHSLVTAAASLPRPPGDPPCPTSPSGLPASSVRPHNAPSTPPCQPGPDRRRVGRITAGHRWAWGSSLNFQFVQAGCRTMVGPPCRERPSRAPSPPVEDEEVAVDPPRYGHPVTRFSAGHGVHCSDFMRACPSAAS